jgi:hypothetical protein
MSRKMSSRPRSSLGHAVTVAAAVVVASACAPFGQYPPVPRGLDAWGVFDVEGRDAWLVFDVDVPAPLDPFAVSARTLGCITEKGGRGRHYSAVLAQCDEGTIVIAAAGFKHVRIACLKPTTREQCEALLDQIGLAGSGAMAARR